MTGIRQIGALLILLIVAFVAALAQQRIEESEVEKWIAEQSGCGDNMDQIHIIKLDAVDFTHDGRSQAIVVAMSCNTGTAGPDVQSVLSRGTDGKLIELNVPTVDTKILEANLFGPGSADLDAQDDLLVLRYTDSTGRENPLVVKYKWSGKHFEVSAMEESKAFPTSYDCAKADENTDRAICHVKSLADLDLQLGMLYKNLSSNLDVSSKAVLRARQRKWVAARNAACPVNNKWFVDCLESRYRERMTDLEKALSPREAAR